MTSIASIDGAGPIWLVYDDAVVITHNATSLILKSGANYTTVAGDVLCFMHEGSGNWREIGSLTTFEAHRDASAAVHGLPASVNVLGDRTAAGEFIQHAVTGNIASANEALSVFYSNSNAITFAVAFTSTPRVFGGGTTTADQKISSEISAVTTTGFNLRIWAASNSTTFANNAWMAIGS